MRKRIFNILCVIAAILVLLITQNSAAYAQTLNPCEEEPIDIQKYGGADFHNPSEIVSQNGVLSTTLEVKYGDNTIAGCPVHLRSYNGDLVGPTLRVKPKDSIKINLINSLPVEEQALEHVVTNNTPQHFNTTNFHSHGLHVSPSGISDNVLRLMQPRGTAGESDPYPIDIPLPSDHPGGTHWYHPHNHGSTAIQVSSGMAGALIVEGRLDQIPEIKNAQEKIFVFQQISYDTTGKLEDFDSSFGIDPATGKSRWSVSGRQTTINGQIYPTIKMRPGEVQRWRLIHAGIRDTIELALQYPNHPNIPLHEIAVDGITLGKKDSWDKLELEPGYRSDVLIQAAKEPGTYNLVDIPTTPQQSLLAVGESGQYLAKVVVEGEPVDMKLPDDSVLLAVKQQEVPSDITQVNGKQNVEFDISGNPIQFMVNGESFNPDDPNPISLKLNNADEWHLSSKVANHPFHIHVNPFQYTRKDPSGKDETIWRDTLMVRANSEEPQIVKSRYTQFDGDFVLHCHILDHEDQGMMKLVQITQ